MSFNFRLKKAGLRNPHSVSVKEKQRENLSTPVELGLLYAILEPKEKLSFLVEFLKKAKNCKIAVFLLTCKQVDYFHAVLRQLMQPIPVIKVS
jgi:ATP-dependent RNA helicase DDX55/SPB4